MNSQLEQLEERVSHVDCIMEGEQVCISGGPPVLVKNTLVKYKDRHLNVGILSP